MIPRSPGGEITPQGLKVIGEIAERYQLYTKITGSQRIGLFGAQKDDLPAITAPGAANAGFRHPQRLGVGLAGFKSGVDQL